MRLILSILLVNLFVSSAAVAEVKVLQRDLYDRIVFDPISVGKIVVKDNNIEIPYGKTIKQDIASVSRVVETVKTDKNSVSLNLKNYVSDTRHFRIGNRIVLDIFFDTKKMEEANKVAVKSAPEEKTTEPQKKNEPAEPVQTSTEDENKKTEPLKDEITHAEIEQVENLIQKQKEPIVVKETAPVLSIDEPTPKNGNPTIVTISSTTPFGLSAFERYGRLIIVADSEDIAVPPQISGVGAEQGWDVTEVPLSGGKAWSIPIPENTFIRPEGSQLIWRLILSDVDPDLKDGTIRRRLIDRTDPKLDIIMSHATKLIKLHDEQYGDDLAVVTVAHASKRMNSAYSFVDFDIIPAPVGAVIKPKSDGVRIASGSQYLTITKSNGLVLSNESSEKIVEAYLDEAKSTLEEKREVKTALDRIFYFEDWGQGIIPYEYSDKRRELEGFLSESKGQAKLGILLNLTKLSLSQKLGHEAIGYLEMAKLVNPQVKDAVEYKALRGAAHFLAKQYDLALTYFDQNDLKTISEIGLWKASSNAALNKIEEAIELYKNNAVLASIYPYGIKMDVLAPLATAMLDQDKGVDAVGVVALLDKDVSDENLETRATLAYLKGRTQNVSGHPDEAISNLYQASLSDKLGPYGIRSELLLINDELAREVIKPEEAIQRMERLRFAWRGDDLETQIQQSLGHLYIENNEPRKGLNILKRAAKNTKSLQERRKVVRTMADAYKTIFLTDTFEDLDPMIAIAVYDEFKELTPVGDEGNALIDGVADKLMKINLFSRATSVLSDKMNRLGEGQDAIKTGLRIAAIQLIDRTPDESLKTLGRVDRMIADYTGEDKEDLLNKIILLKARSYSDAGEPETALFMTEGLDDTDDVIRLRVDTAWRSSRWVAVTDNLSKLLARQNITDTTPPTAEQTQLILNQAVALSLSDQYDALQRFAAQYDTVMKQSPSYKTFLLVTRPQNISNLADRETLLEVTSEVDLFKSFLDNLNK